MSFPPNTTSYGSSQETAAVGPDVANSHASLASQIESLRVLVSVTLAFLIITICAVLLFFCCSCKKRDGADVEADTPSGTHATAGVTNRSVADNGPYNNGFEEISLENMGPSNRRFVSDETGSSHDHVHGGEWIVNAQGNFVANTMAANTPRRAAMSPNLPTVSRSGAVYRQGTAVGCQSVGTDYTRVPRAGRFTEEHMGATGIAGSAYPHNHHAGVSAGSRALDRIHNA